MRYPAALGLISFAHRTLFLLAEIVFERAMPQWDYHKINLNDLPRRKEDIDLLTDAGEEGWELIAITPNNFAYLKRPLEHPAAPQPSPSVRSTRRRTTTRAK